MAPKTGNLGSVEKYGGPSTTPIMTPLGPNEVGLSLVYHVEGDMPSTELDLAASVAVYDRYLRAAYLSSGSRVHVDGLEGIEPLSPSTCLHRVCAALGVLVPRDTCRPGDIKANVLSSLRLKSRFAKVHYDFSSHYSPSNHVMLIKPNAGDAALAFEDMDSVCRGLPKRHVRYMGIEPLDDFFSVSGSFSHVQFYSGNDDDVDAGFGGDVPLADPPSLSFASRSRPEASRGGGVTRDQSISDPSASHGGANLSSGVVRPKRRVVASRSKFNPTGSVAKSYVASRGVQFNNLNEIFLDTISREYAQDILEQLFSAWGVDESDADALKYAEDLVCAFLIAMTASNKAAYNKEFEIPQKGSSILVNFDVFSRILAEGHGVTRRQFARGIADDMHRYIRDPENLHLLPTLATRAGCDPQMAALAFDGSTHCTGLTSAEQSFTRLLEKRNLFEDDSVLADGASQQLMQGMSSGPRSIISR